MTECKATWWRACKFKPRFDHTAPDPKSLPRIELRNTNCTPPDVLNALTSRAYVKDVCERCGKTIERGPK